MDLNRRRFLGGSATFALISPAAAKDEKAYRFLTADAEIEMTIEFHDAYSSRGFWFGEQMSNRNFCLSAGGEEGRNCLAGFRGSLAIALCFACLFISTAGGGPYSVDAMMGRKD